jgi:hypothetical protein
VIKYGHTDIQIVDGRRTYEYEDVRSHYHVKIGFFVHNLYYRTFNMNIYQVDNGIQVYLLDLSVYQTQSLSCARGMLKVSGTR